MCKDVDSCDIFRSGILMSTRGRILILLMVSGILLLAVLGVALAKAGFRLSRGGDGSLLQAVVEEDAEEVQRLLAHGADPNGQEEPVLSRLATIQHRAADRPLHLAAYTGNVKIMKLLLAAGADANMAGPQGCRPLHVAVQIGCKRAAEILIEHGANPDRTSEAPQKGVLLGGPALPICEKGQTVLSLAVLGGHQGLVQYLTRNGAHLADEDSLTDVALRGDLHAVRELVNQGYDANNRGEARLRPLHAAAVTGNVDLASLLIANDAKLDATAANGRTPFFLAVCGGHQSVAQLLLESGADISATDADGATPLHCAAERGYGPLSEWLLDRGADATGRDRYGWTPLHWAARNGHLDIARALLGSTARAGVPDNYGWTPLHCAVAHGHREMVELLTAEGASADAAVAEATLPQRQARRWGYYVRAGNQYTPIARAYIHGETALHMAVARGRADIATVLVSAGASVDCRAKGRKQTPLHIAAESGHEDVAAVLLEAGADTDALSEPWGTPLHVAVAFRQEVIARLLLRMGARADIPNALGQTPLAMAKAMKHERMARLLSQYGATDQWT